jgi:hypothetical protein
MKNLFKSLNVKLLVLFISILLLVMILASTIFYQEFYRRTFFTSLIWVIIWCIIYAVIQLYFKIDKKNDKKIKPEIPVKESDTFYMSAEGSILIQSLIDRKYMQTGELLYKEIGIRTSKTVKGIYFFDENSGESLTIHYESMKKFIIAAAESYVRFDERFKDHVWSIAITINSEK